MRPALWLAVRELAARARRVVLAGAVVAAIAASVTATEILARAREAAVAAQVDAMGAALAVVPRGTSSGDLARSEVEGTLPAETEDGVRRALGWRLRRVDRRVVLHRELAGKRRLVVGVEGIAGDPQRSGRGLAAVGSELGRALPVGATVTIERRGFEVARILPSTGGADDFAVFLPLGELRSHGVNELRVYLSAGVSPRDAEALLARVVPAQTVIRSDRGEVADGALPESLARHRAAAYVIMALVATLTLLIASHLDAAERRRELATLVAIGASRATVLGGVLARSAVVAGAGAIAGALAGEAVAVALEPAARTPTPATFAVAAGVVAAGVLVGTVAAAPTALASAARDPVRELQEG